ncbi:RING finger and transmembrane domain-containing protein 2 isoform X1 [Hemiscyllium ocellatum]|uniref:RING finger and transmembrane domain-containing protein 2 isoform X1 n=1 Tax=Hemiscyllium ocellatum TaxID=170820 RepID=UPI0029660D3C|nr:RING finger and transmembrane domain-containing protein 2 isoform X1 [Hemiscyllium ocellatum]
MIGDFFFQFKRDWKKMQRRHSSNADNIPSERTRSQAVGSETSVDENGVFEGLKPENPSAQQMFSGLTSLQSGPIPAASFQSSLVLGSSLTASVGSGDVFIQMTPQEEGSIRTENMQYHHRHRHHHYHHSHHRSSLLHVSGDRHGNTEDVNDDPGTPAPALSELKAAVNWLQKGLPFILILLAKVCFQHKLGRNSPQQDREPKTDGIAVCIGMASTFAYANLTVKHQVSLREKRSVLVCLWILVFLTGNTLFLYYTFSAQELYKSLIFMKTSVESQDFFDLLWIAGITDFVLKYITIGFKCLILILPRIILAFKSRGTLYLLIEETSQLLRSMMPVQLWYKCIMGEDSINSYLLEGTLIVLYSLCKLLDVCGRIGGLRKALKILCKSQSCGVPATSQQCSEAGDICPICQAEFREPVVLICQHVFCDECACLWFDRERSCPMCRTAVSESLRYWKDGSTSAHFQVY